MRVLACLAEGLGIRATARVFEVEPNTVLHWLAEAAEQLRAFSRYFLCDVHVEQLQLDELYAVLRKRDIRIKSINEREIGESHPLRHYRVGVIQQHSQRGFFLLGHFPQHPSLSHPAFGRVEHENTAHIPLPFLKRWTRAASNEKVTTG